MGDFVYSDIKWVTVDSNYKIATNALKIAATSNDEFDTTDNTCDDDRLGILYNENKGRLYLIAHDRNVLQTYGTVAYMLDKDGRVMQKLTAKRSHHTTYDGKSPNLVVDDDEHGGDKEGAEQFIVGLNGGLGIDDILDHITVEEKHGGAIYKAADISKSGKTNEDVIIDELISMLKDQSQKVKNGATSFIVHHIKNMKFEFGDKKSIARFYRHLQQYKAIAETKGITAITNAVKERKLRIAKDHFTADPSKKDKSLQQENFRKAAESKQVLQWLHKTVKSKSSKTKVNLDKDEMKMLKKVLVRVLGSNYDTYITDKLDPLGSLKKNRYIKQAISQLEEDKWKNLKSGFKFARAFLSWDKKDPGTYLKNRLGVVSEDHMTPDKGLRKAMMAMLEVEFGGSDTVSYRADPHDYISVSGSDHVLSNDDIDSGLARKSVTGKTGVVGKAKEAARKESETRGAAIEKDVVKEMGKGIKKSIKNLKKTLKDKDARATVKTRAKLALLLADKIEDLKMDKDSKWGPLLKAEVTLDESNELHKEFIEKISKEWTMSKGALKVAFNSYTGAMS